MKLDLDRQGSGRTELEVSGSLDTGLPEGRPQRVEITGTLQVDNVESRFLLTGQVAARGIAECGRCLSDFPLEWEVPVEIMVLRDVDTDEGEGDSLVLHQSKGIVDLAEPLRECAVLALPLATICRDDCRGLCAQCGADLNETTCDCTQEEIDPRWEGLP